MVEVTHKLLVKSDTGQVFVFWGRPVSSLDRE